MDETVSGRTVGSMSNLAETAAEIASLVVYRRATWPDTDQLCAITQLPLEVLHSVERHGTNAPFSHIEQYAAALGVSASVRLFANRPQVKNYSSCEECPPQATIHEQVHVWEVRCCVDAGIAPLIAALHSVGIATVLSCEGGPDTQAHLLFPTLQDTRAFYALVDRGPEGIRLRANLRPLNASDAAATANTYWESSVRWFLQPGSLLADAMCFVRFDPSDIKHLTQLAQNPPLPALSALMRPARFVTQRA